MANTVMDVEDMHLGEDTSLLQGNDTDHIDHIEHIDFTTKKEVIGWCLYAWACEPFIVSCVGTYVPLLLEQMARDNGVKLIDHSVPCKETLKVPEPIPPTQPSPIGKNGKKCVLPLFNNTLYIDTSSFALYTFALSVLCQTLVVISVTGAADKGDHRKHILVGSSIIGGLITMCYIFLVESNYYTGAVLAVLANCCFGLVNVCGNSYLPILANNHPDLRTKVGNKSILKGEISSRISGSGAALGYISALLVQLMTMAVIIHLKRHSLKSSADDSIWPIQVAICLVGCWWVVFQVPVWAMLKPRSSQGHLTVKILTLLDFNSPRLNYLFSHYPVLLTLLNQVITIAHYIKYGWKQLFIAFHQASQLKDIVIFLISWFIISDSLTTINSTAILFARSELHMSTLQLSVIGTVTMISAILGAYMIPNFIQPMLKVSLKTLLQLIIIWASVIPFYGILGFFFNSFGLKHSFEMFIVAVWYGFSLGGIATVSRSLFAMLIPSGKESMYFALFQITDKGSSILGPIVVAVITDKTHNIRYCFWFLFGVLLISLPVINLLNLERGNEEAQVLAMLDDE